jgi:hypothetical protein
MPVIPVLGRLGEEDWEFEASLNCIVRLSQEGKEEGRKEGREGGKREGGREEGGREGGGREEKNSY